MTPSRARIAVAYATVYLVWGSTYLAIRGALVGLPPLGMAGSRFLVAGAVMYVAGWLRGERRPTLRHWRDAALVGGMLLTCGNGALVLAERTLSSGVAALLIATQPLALALITWTLPKGRSPSLRATLGIAIGLAGVAVLVASHSGFADTRVDPVGTAFVAFSAVSWAAGSLYASRIPVAARLPSLTASGAQMLAGGAPLVVLGVLHHETVSLQAVGGLAWFSWAYLVVLGSIVAYSAYAWLLTVEPPQRVATYAFVNPIVAVALGCLLADEPLAVGTLASGALITTAVALLVLPSRRA